MLQNPRFLRLPSIVGYLQASPSPSPMDHPCHKCGHSIEDGKAFCTECGAPQIRVTIPEAAPEPIPASDEPAPGLAHEAEPGFSGVSFTSLSTRLPSAVRPCALAAGVAAVL